MAQSGTPAQLSAWIAAVWPAFQEGVAGSLFVTVRVCTLSQTPDDNICLCVLAGFAHVRCDGKADLYIIYSGLPNDNMSTLEAFCNVAKNLPVNIIAE